MLSERHKNSKIQISGALATGSLKSKKFTFHDVLVECMSFPYNFRSFQKAFHFYFGRHIYWPTFTERV